MLYGPSSIPSCSGGPEQPSQVLVDDECYAVSWQDTNEAGPEATVEALKSLLFPGTLDGGGNIRK